ncbi:cupredoxin domain-containing protein, partial [Puniceibacterium confluentis]|uniref:cupredoxin domain-containing protein n=1 Tax=Puniceibacterium confluentis TaxID=1958944 RepID=UPI004036139C
MRTILLPIALGVVVAAPLSAADSPPPPRVHPYDSTAEAPRFGRPGTLEDVTRTVEIRLYDTIAGSRLFEPRAISVETGETVRFRIVNVGTGRHEFFLGNLQEIAEHRDRMVRDPDMPHDGPNSISLERRQSGEVIWTFDQVGAVDYACFVP